jgi:hypothetical protein
LLQTVKEQLVRMVPAAGGRCYGPEEVPPLPAKPFVVVAEVFEHDPAWSGLRRVVAVRIGMAPETGPAERAELALAVERALAGRLLTAGAGWAATGLRLGAGAGEAEDGYEPLWGAVVRELRFGMVILQPAWDGAEPPEAWLEALLALSRTVLGEEWSVQAHLWPAGGQLPALLWRPAGVEALAKSSGLFEIRKAFRAELRGRSAVEQLEGAERLAAALGRAGKLPCGESQLLVKEPILSYRPAAGEPARIAVTLSRTAAAAKLAELG